MEWITRQRCATMNTNRREKTTFRTRNFFYHNVNDTENLMPQQIYKRYKIYSLLIPVELDAVECET